MKKLLCLLTVFALLLSLCACSSNSAETKSEPTESTKPEPVLLTKENIHDYLGYSTSYENGRITIETWPKQPGTFIDCRIRVKYRSVDMTFPEGTNAPIDDYETENYVYENYRLPTDGVLKSSSVEALPYFSFADSFFTSITSAEGMFYPD